MALTVNGLSCAVVLLRNYSLNHSIRVWAWWRFGYGYRKIVLRGCLWHYRELSIFARWRHQSL